MIKLDIETVEAILAFALLTYLLSCWLMYYWGYQQAIKDSRDIVSNWEQWWEKEKTND